MCEQPHYLFVLVAASAVGKSELINKLKSESLWKNISKYSTRDNRGVNDDVVKITDPATVEKEIKYPNNVRHIRMEYIQRICGNGKGVVYYKNSNIYGINIDEIINGLTISNLVVVISDFHVIHELRKDDRLRYRIKILYIASTVDERELLKRFKSRESIDFSEQSTKTLKTINNIEKMCSVLSSAARLKYLSKIEEVLPLLNEQWNNYLPYFDTIKTRSLNIRMLYNRYIDNIAYIDYAILNFYDLEYMFKQVRSIINNLSCRRQVKSPPVFMVCSAVSSGKGTLMEIIGDLGTVNNNISITTKYAKRDKRATDVRDGMFAIGKSGDFGTYISDRKDVWSWTFHINSTEYAVNHADIRRNINDGKAQIFISNMEQIAEAKKTYPDNIVVLYLHATHASATKEHIIAKRKDEYIKICHQKLIENSSSDQTEESIKYYFDNNQKIRTEFTESIEADLREIETVHHRFLLYNHLIDHVLLNTGTREDLVEQMTNLINYYGKPIS